MANVIILKFSLYEIPIYNSEVVSRGKLRWGHQYFSIMFNAFLNNNDMVT